MRFEQESFDTFWANFLKNPRTKVDLQAKQIRFIDLFSSVGGLSLGFSTALEAHGLLPRPILGVDIDARALGVYQSNWPTARVLNESVKNLVEYKTVGLLPDVRFAYAPELASEVLTELVGKVDVIVAGPPCQGHSNLNNSTRGNDPRNELYLSVPAIAVALGVGTVIIENVPGAVNDQSRVTQRAISLFRSEGYNITDGVISADSAGWPQTRKRYFMIATKHELARDLKAVAAEFARDPSPISWAIGDLVDSPNESDIMNSAPALSNENQSRLDVLFQENLHDLPLEYRPECHRNGTSYSSSYGRMHWDRPAPTLTTGLFSPGRGRFVHPVRKRMLTPLEAARIQGFPDWYQFRHAQFETGRTDLAKWIGDAVPSILGYIAAVTALGLRK